MSETPKRTLLDIFNKYTPGPEAKELLLSARDFRMRIDREQKLVEVRASFDAPISKRLLYRVEEEIRLAKLIAERGILYQVEWWHNTAGVICGAEEYLFDGDADSLRAKVEAIMSSNTAMSLAGAKEQGITPTEWVYRYCEDLLYK